MCPLTNKYVFVDKDLGFLRIGSLNVRVKKTTEAFSNFLGYGSGTINPFESLNEKIHKGWGSADNLNQVRYMSVIGSQSNKRFTNKSLIIFPVIITNVFFVLRNYAFSRKMVTTTK